MEPTVGMVDQSVGQVGTIKPKFRGWRDGAPGWSGAGPRWWQWRRDRPRGRL